MNSFKLYVYKNEKYRILITDYKENNNTNSLYSTFNEHLEFGENDQLTFTFSLMKYIDRFDLQRSNNLQYNQNLVQTKRLENQFHKLFQMGSQIELVINNTEKYIFVITNIKPTINNNNVKFDYTCQDEISYRWSRRNLGMSYSTVEVGGVRTIYEIANDVFTRAGITDWMAVPKENNEISTNLLSDTRITLEVQDSNPYNIIIEACNALNAYMKIDWTHKTISFYQKDKIKFSGYRYRPKINLKSLDVDFNIDEMATIMHVYGGTDENNQIVSLMPPAEEYILDWWKIHHSDHKEENKINWYDVFIEYISPKDVNTKSDLWLNDNQVYNIDGYYYIFIYGWHSTFYELEITLRDNNGIVVTSNIKPIMGTHRASIHRIEATTDSAKIIKLIQINADKTKEEIDPKYYRNYIKVPPAMESTFCGFAVKNPSLGNFLYNFDFFLNNGQLSQSEYNKILNIFEVQMAYNNLWLKYYEPAYWRLEYQLHIYIQEAKAILENLQAARLSAIEVNEKPITENKDIINLKSQYDEKKLLISGIIQSLYNNYICINNFNPTEYEPIPQQLFNSKIGVLQDLVNEYWAYQNMKQECANNKDKTITGTDDYEIAQQQADKEYYTSKYYTLLSVVGENGYYYNKKRVAATGDNNIVTYQIITCANKFMATYPQLIIDIYNTIQAIGPSPAIYDKVQEYTQANDTLWTNLYHDYGQYIYEQKYENADELNSTSLFNQAIDYFEDYSKPAANYSISILELSVLEAVDTPRLTVGSKIKIYNDELNLNEKQATDDEEPLNNLQFTNNDLVVTSLNYNLRQAGDVSINVEKISSYQSILQKLIQTVN